MVTPPRGGGAASKTATSSSSPVGPEHSSDPATGTRPKVVPELPPHTPYPCRTKQPGSDEWVEHNR